MSPPAQRNGEANRKHVTRETSNSWERRQLPPPQHPWNAVERPTVSVLLEHGSPTVSLEIEGETKRLIVDTGSNVPILQPGVSQSGVNATSINPYGVTGEALSIKYQQHVTFVLGGQKIDHTFFVCPLPTETDGLLGTDILDGTGAEINFDCGKLSLTGNYKTPQHVMACPQNAQH